jgi:hypothetical protein
MATKQIISIHVVIDVLSKDRLRKFSFGLEKDTDPKGVESWVIHFNLFERTKATDDWNKDAVIHVDVDVKAKNNSSAEASSKGFNRAQTEATQLDVAAATDRVKAGKATPARVGKAAEDVVAMRS